MRKGAVDMLVMIMMMTILACRVQTQRPANHGQYRLAGGDSLAADAVSAGRVGRRLLLPLQRHQDVRQGEGRTLHSCLFLPQGLLAHHV